MECHKCKKELLILDGGKMMRFRRDNDVVISIMDENHYCWECGKIEYKKEQEAYDKMLHLALIVKCLKKHRKDCSLCRNRKEMLDNTLNNHLTNLSKKIAIHEQKCEGCNGLCQTRKNIINYEHKKYAKIRTNIKHEFPTCEEIKMLNKGFPEFKRKDKRFKEGPGKRKGRPVTKKLNIV